MLVSGVGLCLTTLGFGGGLVEGGLVGASVEDGLGEGGM